VNTNETETTEYEAFLAELQFQRERAEACGVWPQEIFGALVCSNCEHYNDIDSNFCGMCGMLL
jgi:hypothetical protein